jgi:anti-anti-sigma regulatory factor
METSGSEIPRGESEPHISIKTIDGTAVSFRIEDDIIVSNYKKIEERFRGLSEETIGAEEGAEGVIIVDLLGAKSFDSAGPMALIHMKQAAEKTNKNLVLRMRNGGRIHQELQTIKIEGLFVIIGPGFEDDISHEQDLS